MPRSEPAPAGPRPTPARTVADAMLTDVKLNDPGTTVRELRSLFDDAHVHAAVIVEAGVLLAVVEREDLDGAELDAPAVHLGARQSRTVAADTDLEQAWQLMRATGLRRLAAVGADGSFAGLLCLKRTGAGFCSDRDVRNRRFPRSMSGS